MSNFVEKEIDFFIKVLVENGYQRSSLKKMADEVIRKYTSAHTPGSDTTSEMTEEPKKRITLPWIPKVSPKLRKMCIRRLDMMLPST